ncbi:hypothetical protein MD484_g6160, partial [Candolleomyces efflorescens]
MPQLFDVPGWSVAEPTASGSKSEKSSKKRKRPTSDTSSKLLSAELNLEKLMDKLRESTKPDQAHKAESSGKFSLGKSKKAKKQSQDKSKPQQPEAPLTREISLPKPLQPAGKQLKEKRRSFQDSRPEKRQKVRHSVDAPQALLPPRTQSKSASPDSEANLTAMQKSMRASLEGAKFRMINENLYKSDSQAAVQMMQEDPTVYREYHAGFRHQVQTWPTNPVQQYISLLKSYPPRTVVADLGCGDAALARGLLPEGLIVLSFDLISDGMYVVEADACTKVPLPGSEPESQSGMGEAQITDVVVCSLSLMNTNWPNCLREAWRILKPSGELQIAEVASRFTDVKEFEKVVSSIGFRLSKKDDRNSHFTLFEFEKVARKPYSEKEWAKISQRSSVLKPCEYKRR